MNAPYATLLPLCLLLSITVQVTSLAQQVNNSDTLPLQNGDVLRMVQARVPSDAIVAKIRTSRCHFDTFPGVLAELKYRGVPGEVLTAMIEASDPKRPKIERTSLTAPLAAKLVSAPSADKAPVPAVNKPPATNTPAAGKLITASHLAAIQEIAPDRVRLFPEKFESQVLKLKGWVGYLKRERDVVLVKFLAKSGNEFPPTASPGQITIALPIAMAEELEDFYEKTSVDRTTYLSANVTGYCIKMLEKNSCGTAPVYYLYTLRLALLDHDGKDGKVILDKEFVDRDR
jgi:hypothetical protein